MADFDLTPAPEPSIQVAADDGYQALVRIGDELSSMQDSDVAHINLDIPRACARAIGALPALRSLRPSIVEHLPTFDIAAVDRLEDYAHALYYAHLGCSPPRAPGHESQALYQQASELRALLLAQAELLAMKGLLDAAKLSEIRSGSGYIDTANDVVALSLQFRQSWSAVQGKCVVTQDDCERADVVGRALLTAMGVRMVRDERLTKEETRQRRSRCFTLFVRAYDRCRQAAGYLRWAHGDADRLVPPLSTRARRKRAPHEAEPTT